jgi:hypothetical protein
VVKVSLRDLKEPWIDLSVGSLEKVEGYVAIYLEEARRARLQTDEVEKLIGVLSLARLGNREAELALGVTANRRLLAEIVLWHRGRLQASMEERSREKTEGPEEIVALAEEQSKDLERLRGLDRLLVWKTSSGA